METLSKKTLHAIANGYHNNVESCYRSQYASWEDGFEPKEEIEWVKKSSGKWNGYPPRKWINPAVCQDGNQIVITTTSKKQIKLPVPPNKIVKNICPNIQDCVLTSFKGNKAYGYLPRNGKWIVNKVVELPEGYIFNRDKTGVRVFCKTTKADYHFTECGISLGADQLVKQLIENRIEREKHKKAQVLANKSKARICFCDSLNAGNCAVGTMEFCKRFKLDPNTSHPVQKILRICKGTNLEQRARIAVNYAIKRHEQLIAAGAEVFYPGVKYKCIIQDGKMIVKES